MPPRGQIRRRLQDEIAQQIRARIELAVEGSKSLRIGMTEARDTAFGAAFGGEQMPAVQRGKEILRAAFDDPQPMIEEAKIAR